VFNSASQAHLKALVSRDMLVDASGRLEASQWLSVSVGPTIGGALVGLLTVFSTMVIDAFSFLASAVAVWRIRTPEPPPPTPIATASRWTELAGGLRFVRGHTSLRRILLSWIIFAGASAMGAALTSIYYLSVLHFPKWQYGLLMGVPSLGGFAGARLTRRVVARVGSRPRAPVGEPAARPVAIRDRGRDARHGRPADVWDRLRHRPVLLRHGELGDVELPAAGDTR
jgi:hypothetical protein